MRQVARVSPITFINLGLMNCNTKDYRQKLRLEWSEITSSGAIPDQAIVPSAEPRGGSQATNLAPTNQEVSSMTRPLARKIPFGSVEPSYT